MEEEVAERSPLEQMVYDAVYAAVRDWLDEENIADQMCDSVREGIVEATEGTISFWGKKASTG